MKSLFKYSSILTLSLILVLASCTQPAKQKEQVISKGLKDLTEIPIGGSIDIVKVLEDEKLRKITTQNFSSITSGNDMKMYSIAAKEGVYNWRKVDSLVAFTERNNQRLFGHTLVWHLGLPKWIAENGETNGTEWVDSYLEEYIKTVAGRYKGKVAAWDVVNEAFESSGGAFRKTFWYEYLGEEYIAKAFQYAHEADSNAVLFYNDFNIERDTAKLNGVLSMVERLKSQGVPIMGIGFQMHIRMDIPNEVIGQTLKKAAETGLQIHISELDIIFNKHNDQKGGGIPMYDSLTNEMAQAQAQKYKDLVLLYRKNVPKEQQYGITLWSFTDRDSWIEPFFGVKDWPTLFDEKLDPKPAYDGFAEGLKTTLK